MRASFSRKIPLALSAIAVVFLLFFCFREKGTGEFQGAVELMDDNYSKFDEAPISPSQEIQTICREPVPEESLVPFQLHALVMKEAAAVVNVPNGEDPIAELQAKVHKLTVRNKELEVRLALTESGQIGKWAAKIHPGTIPDQDTLLNMAYFLRDYPVELTAEEGSWLAARTRNDDWDAYAPTVDEAIFWYLRPERLEQELTAEQFLAIKPTL